MQEVLIDVCKHSSGCLERVVGCFDTSIISAVLIGGMTGEDGGYVEDDRCLFIGQRVLGSRLVSERVVPRSVSDD